MEFRDSAHALNNQLTTMLAIADMESKRRADDPPAASAFQKIAQAARASAEHADALSQFARDRAYLRRLGASSDPLLLELQELCERDGIPAVEPDTGRFLSVMVSCMLAGSILELGTAYGYSSLWMARAQPETGRIWTIDPDTRRTAIARSFFERAGVADRIEIIEQPALEVLPKLAQRQYDIVFIDALKEEYEQYFNLALPHVKRSGLLIIDNLLWHHRAAAPPAEDDEPATKSIRRFNSMLMSHQGVAATILPVGDGVGVAAKLT